MLEYNKDQAATELGRCFCCLYSVFRNHHDLVVFAEGDQVFLVGIYNTLPPAEWFRWIPPLRQ